MVGNHREEDWRKKEGKELAGGEGGVWRLGEELAANFAISEKQNAEGKWGSKWRGGDGAGIWWFVAALPSEMESLR